MEHMEGVPVRQVSCTIRKASVPADSWYQDPAEGGGILFGDVCHFIDLAIWFQRSLPLEVHALATTRPKPRRGKLDDPTALRQWRLEHCALRLRKPTRLCTAKRSIS